MSSQVICASRRVDVPAPARAHPPSIGRQLERFRPNIRPAVSALAARHSRLADLCLSFPALLAALACPRAGFDVRGVVACVIDGGSLAELAEAARVPLWLRRMRPEMVVRPLPLLPDSGFLRHRIANHFPAHPNYAARWFETVARGGHWAHDEFALWCARVYAASIPRPRRRRWRRRRGRNLHNFNLLCLWAWYSKQHGTRGHALIETPWTAEMEIAAALDAAWSWDEMLQLEFILAGRPIEDMWLRPGAAGGHDFVPLLGASDIAEEAKAMRHCVGTYGGDVAHGHSRLWSVRRDGRRVATLEVNRRGNNPLPFVGQLKLAENQEPSAELWLAVDEWFRAQQLHQFAGPASSWGSVDFGAVAWRGLWKPYWLAKRTIPDWLPLTPSRRAFDDL